MCVNQILKIKQQKKTFPKFDITKNSFTDRKSKDLLKLHNINETNPG